MCWWRFLRPRLAAVRWSLQKVPVVGTAVTELVVIGMVCMLVAVCGLIFLAVRTLITVTITVLVAAAVANW